MERISLTYFTDFVLRSGTPKLTGVREIKEDRDENYSDFYRPIREAIISMHEEGLPPDCLKRFLASIHEERRQRLYEGIVDGYIRFLRHADIEWFEPPVTGLPLGDIEININPELGLVIDRRPHLIKAYFRTEPLSTKRSSVVLHLLESALGDAYPGHVIAMLDVRRSKLHTAKALNPKLDLLLRGEARSFSMIYASL